MCNFLFGNSMIPGRTNAIEVSAVLNAVAKVISFISKDADCPFFNDVISLAFSWIPSLSISPKLLVDAVVLLLRLSALTRA